MWKRLRGYARRPFFWLALVCVGVWFFVIQANLHPLPTHIVNTAPVDEDGRPIPFKELDERPHVCAVSDDGGDVIVEMVMGFISWGGSPPDDIECWNTRTRRATIPRANLDPVRQRLQQTRFRHFNFDPRTGFEKLRHDAEGWNYLFDEPAWLKLKERFTNAAEEYWTLWPQHEPRHPGDAEFLPPSLWFSPDGRYVAYETLDDLPIFDRDAETIDGTVLENSRTGERLAFLPTVRNVLAVSRDGRWALTNGSKKVARWLGRRRMIIRDADGERWENLDHVETQLWDLCTGTSRTTLLLPEPSTALVFSTDGGYLLVHWRASDAWRLSWWDIATGQQRGTVECSHDHLILDGGRTLMTTHSVPSDTKNPPVKMLFWNLATGAKIDEWDFGREEEYGTLHNFKTSLDGATFIAAFSPTRQPDTFANRVQERVLEQFTKDDPYDQRWYIMFDRRRGGEVARFRGSEAAYSANGQWLATSDHEGILRVWKLPAHKPWFAISTAALFAGVLSAVVLWYSHRWGLLPSAWLLWLGRRLVRGKRFASERG